jgi:hypothetical protein
MTAQAAQLFPMEDCDNSWRDEVFEFLTEKLEQIVEQNPMEKIDDITGAIFRNKSEILGQFILGFIKKNYNDLLNQQYCDCPICGKRLKAWNEKAKRTIESLGGRLDLYRPYFYCKKCKHGFCPLDEALGLATSPKQHDIQDVEAWLSSELPFETAAEAFRRCTGDTLSADHMFETANRIAEPFDILDICPTKEEIEEKVNSLSKGKFRRPVMMMAIDGAHAPTRAEPSPWKGKRGKGEWKEAKGLRLYLIDTDRIIHLISWHQIQDEQEFAEGLLKVKAAGLIPESKVRLCIVGDGAEWIWNKPLEIFSSAKEVLDYYHCSEYIHAVANAQYGKGNRRAQEWVEATFARLFHNNVKEVIGGLKRMMPTSPAAEEKIADVIRYLSKRKDRVNYGSAKRAGYHFGSGAIESANKFISHVRLKRSGAWWYPTNANNILKLRCAKYNGTYDRIIEKYKQMHREKTYSKFHSDNKA